MTIIKGKKGQLLIYGLIAGLIVAVVLAYVSSAADKREFPVIGESSLRLIDLSIEAEKALLHIDQSAKYSAYQAIYDNAKQGGCDTSGEIGGNVYSGYSLWNIENQDENPSTCDPSSDILKDNFMKDFKASLSLYLPKEKIELSPDNYILNIEDNDLKGDAIRKLVVRKEIPLQLGEPDVNGIYKYTASGATPIWYRHIGNGEWEWTPYDPDDASEPNCWMPVAEIEVSKACGGRWDGQKPVQANKDIINYLNLNLAYSIKPSFIVDLGNYDFFDYDRLGDMANDLISECGGKSSKICVGNNKGIFNKGNFELSTCDAGDYVKLLDYGWYSDARYSIYGFCVKKGENKVYASDWVGGEIDLRDVEYKFALQLEDVLCNVDEIPNTYCLELSCGTYFSCESAVDICYCPDPTQPSLGNACIGKCNLFCSKVTTSLITDDDVEVDLGGKTLCKEFSCSSYMNCGTASTCGCPDPSAELLDDACIIPTDGDCVTLHCERDDEFEDKEKVKTSCKSEACDYYDKLEGHSCGYTESCQCDSDSGMNTCEGDCTCIPQPKKTGCGGNCGSHEIWETTYPFDCKKNPFETCGDCDPNCDECDCQGHNDCGGCSWEECPEEDEEDDEDECEGEECDDGGNGEGEDGG